MQILPKQTVFVGFGDMEQKRGEKFVIQGKLTIAENVRQDKTKVYTKRYGYLAMDSDTDTGGSIATAGDIGTTGDALVLKTKTDVWLRSVDQAKWIHRGAMGQVMPAITEITGEGGRRPTHVVHNGFVWAFWGTTADRWYSVTEFNTGIVVQPPTKFSTGTAGGVSQMRAVVAGGFVWCYYWTSTGNNVLLAKFDPATPAVAPTQTTYATVSAGNIEAWDIVSALGGVIFAAVGSGGSFTIAGVSAGIHVSRLNTATGLADGTGWTTNGAAAAYDGPGTFIQNHNGAGDNTVYFLSRVSATGAIAHFGIDRTTLAIAFTNIGTGGTAVQKRGGIVGYRLASGDKTIVTTDTSGSVINAVMHRRVYVSGGAHTASILRRGMWCASYPFSHDGRVYVMTGTEATGNLQRAWNVVDIDSGKICGRTLYQRGGDVWFRAGATAGADRWEYGHVTQVTVHGVNALITANNAFTPDPVGVLVQPYGVKLLAWDLGPYLGPPVTAGGVALLPGGFPQAILSESFLCEPTPAMYPPTAGASVIAAGGNLANGGGTASYGTSVKYAFRDPSGNVYRSAPSPIQTLSVSVNNSRVDYVLPTLRNTNFVGTVMIEIYFTAMNDSTLRLHSTVANDTTVDTVAASITNVPAVDAEIIAEDSGVLSSIALPPCRWAAAWRERFILGHTDEEGAIWPSQTFVAGFGPSFNETLRFHVREGTGPVYAGGAIDFNSFALFKADSVYFISGRGPDRQGRENYQPLRIHGAPGCTNPRSVVTTPLGLFYQATENRGIWLITPSLQAVYIGAGVDDYKSSAILAAVLHSYEKRVVFVTGGVRNLVFDYGNPLPEEGSIGRWTTEVPLNGTAWGVGSAAVAQGSGFFMVATGGGGFVQQWIEGQYDDNGQAINRRVKTAPIQLAGFLNYQRLYRGQFLGEFRGNFGLVLTVETDYGTTKGGASETFPTKTVTAAGSPIYEFRPTANKKPTAIAIELAETGGHLTEGFTVEGFALEIGVKAGLRRVETNRQL